MSRATRERARIWYEKKKRDTALRTSNMFTRTEDGTMYQFNKLIANMFAGWSSKQRDNGKTPTFREFYNGLPDDHKKVIKVTEVFKSTQP